MTQRKLTWSARFFLQAFFLAAVLNYSAFAQEAQTPANPPPIVNTPAPAANQAATAPAAKIDKGDNAWMLTSSALVLMMTIPGLFLFYGGLVRSKNILATIMHSFIMVGCDQRSVGAVGLFVSIRTRHRRMDRFPFVVGLERRRS